MNMKPEAGTLDVAVKPNGDWITSQSSKAMLALKDCVEISGEKLGGVPVLRGTRFSIPQLFAELAESNALVEISQDFEIDVELARKFLHALAVYLNKPVTP